MYTMKLAKGKAVESSVERGMGDHGIYHAAAVCGLAHGRNVHAGIFGHHGIDHGVCYGVPWTGQRFTY